MSLESVLDAEGVADPAKDPGLPTELLLKIYDAMIQLRTLDVRMMNLQRQGRIGFYGTATGEEAAALGSAAAVLDSDWVFPALRQGSVLLWRGFPLKAYIAQLIGNTGDVLNGHQMPCHYADRGVNVVAWSSVIATQLPHAVGMAYAARLKKTKDIAVAYLGDGATSSGDFHAAMNFAGVWKAPVVFVCHNNQWAISVPVEARPRSRRSCGRPMAMVCPACESTATTCWPSTARSRGPTARSGGGPTFIECVTYRMGGHSSSDDPTRYRDEQVVESWPARSGAALPPLPRRPRPVGRGEGRPRPRAGTSSSAPRSRKPKRCPHRRRRACSTASTSRPALNLREQRDWLASEGEGHVKGEGRFPL
jgi:pyruvate dehydrogenase E1 component alpha subunit/2-oxoisovalerate dehydrogenase E1 component alpha subunit